MVPEAAKAGDVYTVYLVSGGKDVGSDSFVVATKRNPIIQNRQGYKRVW